MATGCRDCRTCTMPAMSRWGLWWLLTFVYLGLLWIPWMIKRGTMRHCPTCRHLLSRHLRRADRSFMD